MWTSARRVSSTTRYCWLYIVVDWTFTSRGRGGGGGLAHTHLFIDHRHVSFFFFTYLIFVVGLNREIILTAKFSWSMVLVCWWEVACSTISVLTLCEEEELCKTWQCHTKVQNIGNYTLLWVSGIWGLNKPIRVVLAILLLWRQLVGLCYRLSHRICGEVIRLFLKYCIYSRRCHPYIESLPTLWCSLKCSKFLQTILHAIGSTHLLVQSLTAALCIRYLYT